MELSEVEQEHREHPWTTKAQAERIVKEHHQGQHSSHEIDEAQALSHIIGSTSKKTEFPEERKGVITNLCLFAWHTDNLLCPFCMEKHGSLIHGLSAEIASGNEGDQETYREVSEIFSQVIDKLQKNKAIHAFTEEDVGYYRDLANSWRRKLQGASEAGHSHSGTAEAATSEGTGHNHKL